MNELQKAVEPVDKRTQQEKHFDEVYAVFFAFYQDKLRNSKAPHERIRLLLTTQFFDDVSLQKNIHPVFAKYTTTVAEKQAIARLAFYDALLIHKMSRYNDATTAQLFKNDEDLENKLDGVYARVTALESKPLPVETPKETPPTNG